jgi:AmmeMemoRadiSam system protein B
MSYPIDTLLGRLRHPAVAGSFYPAGPDALAAIVDRQLADAAPTSESLRATAAGLAGILVPHAGLEYSGWVAATAWRLAASVPPATGSPAANAPQPPTIVLLGTNHGAGWLTGIGIWDAGAWATPFGEVEVDDDLAAEIAGLGSPFEVDREAHLTEHSLEVQLPFIRRTMPAARIVPLSVASGTGRRAVRAGEALGGVLSARRARGERILVAISTDMAHYPPAGIATRITDELAPRILALDPEELAAVEAAVSEAGMAGVRCGMCGIQPSTVGLAALRTMGAGTGLRLAAATSADVGGPAGRTVGYLAVAFSG